ncbi:mRNA-degrading endonuclease RelE, toxin component of the RelBE toxin-antitoxin system [Sanguibacter gelidistatuariae]|uniref:mRNA-degrading endonuclease RelE, toxin component of the RelBE toxin-antitoxin system n=1 Tax=Sanguibacter gelidistatuariae TaxID=1814289 RepID=A0A1G6WBQ9_9MICO|nr:type II toxin-antitoxin system RelE/ParE family toxin [Sanguibacter gelidistatuariae]SDD62486.1 mRNA-degrading endonuclease RelE, toxin component of the RelBE toxin-antitoxin system [Sanguibacter gelidistatuariae]
MTYEVSLAPPARHAIASELTPAVAAAVLEFLAGPLAEDPFRVGKSLRNELKGKWSARRGEYRVIYTINARVVTVYVLSIAHRRNVYRPQ